MTVKVSRVILLIKPIIRIIRIIRIIMMIITVKERRTRMPKNRG